MNNKILVRGTPRQNEFEDKLYKLVFGCDDEGQVIEPKSPQEYIARHKETGILFKTEDYDYETMRIGCSWGFKKGREPIIKYIPYEVVIKILQSMD